MAYNLDAVLASTHARIEKKFQDNLSKQTPMFFKFAQEGGKVLIEGGKELTFPVILGNGNAGSFFGDDTLNISRPAGLQPLTYNWKQFYSSITIDGIEEIMNAGEEGAADIVEGRMTQAEITTANAFEDMLVSDGTGNVGAGDGVARDWNGLQNIVADDPTTGTIGGLSRATYTQLRNQVFSTAVTGFNTNQAGRNAMTTLWANCNKGPNRSPNFGITTVAIWTLFNLSLTANERFVMENSDKPLASAGFQSITFMGNVPIVFTNSTSFLAAHMYFLKIAKPKTTGGTFLLLSKSANFKMRPFQKPIDQDKRVALVLTAGQFATDAPYLNGVATNITG